MKRAVTKTNFLKYIGLEITEILNSNNKDRSFKVMTEGSYNWKLSKFSMKETDRKLSYTGIPSIVIVPAAKPKEGM